MFLAVLFSNALYGGIFRGPLFVVSPKPFVLSVLFAVGALVIGWPLRDRLARAAWVLFAVYSALHVLVSVPVGSALVLLLASLHLVIGVRLTASGARARQGGVVLSSAVFAVACILLFAAQYYADVLLGNRSVMSRVRDEQGDDVGLCAIAESFDARAATYASSDWHSRAAERLERGEILYAIGRPQRSAEG